MADKTKIGLYYDDRDVFVHDICTDTDFAYLALCEGDGSGYNSVIVKVTKATMAISKLARGEVFGNYGFQAITQSTNDIYTVASGATYQYITKFPKSDVTSPAVKIRYADSMIAQTLCYGNDKNSTGCLFFVASANAVYNRQFTVHKMFSDLTYVDTKNVWTGPDDHQVQGSILDSTDGTIYVCGQKYVDSRWAGYVAKVYQSLDGSFSKMVGDSTVHAYVDVSADQYEFWLTQLCFDPADSTILWAAGNMPQASSGDGQAGDIVLFKIIKADSGNSNRLKIDKIYRITHSDGVRFFRGGAISCDSTRLYINTMAAPHASIYGDEHSTAHRGFTVAITKSNMSVSWCRSLDTAGGGGRTAFFRASPSGLDGDYIWVGGWSSAYGPTGGRGGMLCRIDKDGNDFTTTTYYDSATKMQEVSEATKITVSDITSTVTKGSTTFALTQASTNPATTTVYTWSNQTGNSAVYTLDIDTPIELLRPVAPDKVANLNKTGSAATNAESVGETTPETNNRVERRTGSWAYDLYQHNQQEITKDGRITKIEYLAYYWTTSGTTSDRCGCAWRNGDGGTVRTQSWDIDLTNTSTLYTWDMTGKTDVPTTWDALQDFQFGPYLYGAALNYTFCAWVALRVTWIPYKKQVVDHALSFNRTKQSIAKASPAHTRWYGKRW